MTNCFLIKNAGDPWLGRSVTSGSRMQIARTWLAMSDEGTSGPYVGRACGDGLGSEAGTRKNRPWPTRPHEDLSHTRWSDERLAQIFSGYVIRRQRICGADYEVTGFDNHAAWIRLGPIHPRLEGDRDGHLTVALGGVCGCVPR